MLTGRTNLPKARTEKLIIKELADETLIYDAQTDEAHCLNRTAALVWQNCDGKRGVDEIAELVEDDIGTTVSADVVWLALDQLEEFKLLEAAVATPAHIAGMSRRRAIQVLGLAAASIPLITSLIAPIAAQAQSCGAVPLPENCPCTASAECQQGCCRTVGGVLQCKSGAGGCV